MDRKWGFFIVFFLLFTNLTVSVTNAHAATWSTTILDASRFFDKLSSRYIAVDKNGNPHIVYGGNGLYYAYYDGNAWHYETVESLLNVDYNASIAIDNTGDVHISYYASGHLKYATNASGIWITESVDSSGDVGEYTSIAVDSSGKVHISYVYYDYAGNHTYTYKNLQYATNVSGTWTTEIIDTDLHSNYTSIAVDSSGKAHISYETYNDYEIYNDSYNYYNLKYATNVSGPWTTETIASPKVKSSYYMGNSIAVDSSGKVHISYSEYNNNDQDWSLKYATNTSGIWTTEKLASGRTPSIAVDSSDNIHISYYAFSSLCYATNSSGAWLTETIDSTDDYDMSLRPTFYSSIAVDVSGNVHISYDGANGTRLFYVTNTSGKWATETIDIRFYAGEYPSIAVDLSSNVHISYESRGNYSNEGKIKYATNTPGTWTTETIANQKSGDSSLNAPSVSVDASNKVHICYSEGSYYKFLIYATNASGTWTTESLSNDYLGNIGYFPSIAVDLSGNVHIGYNDDGLDLFKYATNTSGAWATETIGSSNADNYRSLTVDSSGKVHIGYSNYEYGYDYDKGTLYYTTNSSGTWTTETIASLKEKNQNYYMGGSIAVDSSGKAHISYSEYNKNDANRSLKYATNTFGTWTTETVASGYMQSIAVDSSEKVHIGYYDSGYLCYATNSSGTWINETIVRIGDDIYGYTSIVLDRSDNVHISCYDSKSKGLRYSTTKNITGLKVTTGSPTDVSPASTDLTGTIVPNGTTTVWFEYGQSSGSYTKMSPTQSVSGDDKSKVTVTINGLSNDTTYYYRLVAQNSIGATYGEEKSFTVGTPSQTPTVTPTPTPTSTCEVKAISLSEKKLTLQRNESKEITVTLTGDDDCSAEGTRIKRKVSSAGKNCVSVAPGNKDADADGKATFTITAKNKTGNAKVTFSAGKINKSLTVKVKK